MPVMSLSAMRKGSVLSYELHTKSMEHNKAKLLILGFDFDLVDKTCLEKVVSFKTLQWLPSLCGEHAKQA